MIRGGLAHYQKADVSAKTTSHIREMLSKALEELKKTRENFLSFHPEFSPTSASFSRHSISSTCNYQFTSSTSHFPRDPSRDPVSPDLQFITFNTQLIFINSPRLQQPPPSSNRESSLAEFNPPSDFNSSRFTLLTCLVFQSSICPPARKALLPVCPKLVASVAQSPFRS